MQCTQHTWIIVLLVSKEVKSSRVRKEGLLSRILLMLDDKVFKHFTGVEQLKREGIGIDLDSKDTERERERENGNIEVI